MSSTPPNGKNRNPCLKGWCGKWLAESRWGSRCGICSTPPGWGFFCVWATAPHACCWVQAKRYALSATPLCWPWGRFLYRSAAMSRFYAGQPRWYTLAGCVLCFLASRAALEPLLSGVEAFVRWCLAWPFVMLWRAVLRPFAGAVSARFQRVRTAHSAGRVKKKPGGQKEKVAKQRPRVV